MKLILADLNGHLVEEWSRAFDGVANVEIHHADILRLRGEAIVSPANSYGWMDGGIDLAYRKFFGMAIEVRLIEAIARERRPDYELPVGEALAIPAVNPHIKWLISAPTMRTPGPLPKGSRNAFLAMRAALQCASAHGFQSVLCPGLGTATGRIPLDEAADQMRQAYDAVAERN